MERFGNKVAAARKSQGMSQLVLAGMTGLDQPRLSRIESCEVPASAEVIDKIASALGQVGINLVRGTDREEYYRKRTTSPERLALERSFLVLTLAEAYQRIFDLFDAAYGGGLAAPQIRGEEGYIELRTLCEKSLRQIEEFEPGISATAFFPDHVELRDQNDLLIDEWCEFDRGQVKDFQRKIIHLKSIYCREVSPELLAGAVSYLNLDKVDVMVASIRSERERIEDDFRQGKWP